MRGDKANLKAHGRKFRAHKRKQKKTKESRFLSFIFWNRAFSMFYRDFDANARLGGSILSSNWCPLAKTEDRIIARHSAFRKHFF
jgi:hypothetical protein